MSLCEGIAMQLQALTIPQLRRLSSLIEDSIRRCNEERVQCETERSEALLEIGNLLHDSVIVSSDEVITSLAFVVVSNSSGRSTSSSGSHGWDISPISLKPAMKRTHS